MKKILFILIFIFACLPKSAQAQQAEIVQIKGKVSFKANATDDWQNANVGLLLLPDTQIKTGFLGKCTIAFDSNRKNTVTINKNTQITIRDILPGSVFLSKGRVFTLIRNQNNSGEFTITTPTAVTGARGTSWMTEFENGETFVSVFENDIFIDGLDAYGERTTRVELSENFQTVVSSEGDHEEPKPVPEQVREIYQGEIKKLEMFHQEPRSLNSPAPPPADIEKQKQQMVEELRYSGEYTEEEIRAIVDNMFQNKNMNPRPRGENVNFDPATGQYYDAAGNIVPPPERPEYDKNGEKITFDPATGMYYDSTGNVMPPPKRNEYDKNVTFDPATGQYYDASGNLIPPPRNNAFQQHSDKNVTFDPATGQYYDASGNLMPPPERNKFQRQNDKNITFDAATGQYYDTSGNVMPPPKDNEHVQHYDDNGNLMAPPSGDGTHFNQYMTGINGAAPPPGGNFNSYAGDEYFGIHDQAWSGDGGFYVHGDNFHEYQNEADDIIFDQNHCPQPYPPPCWFDPYDYCPAGTMPPPGCNWPPEATH